jgi:hypothetical protein
MYLGWDRECIQNFVKTSREISWKKEERMGITLIWIFGREIVGIGGGWK